VASYRVNASTARSSTFRFQKNQPDLLPPTGDAPGWPSRCAPGRDFVVRGGGLLERGDIPDMAGGISVPNGITRGIENTSVARFWGRGELDLWTGGIQFASRAARADRRNLRPGRKIHRCVLSSELVVIPACKASNPAARRVCMPCPTAHCRISWAEVSRLTSARNRELIRIHS
jgi:hypothetical protein